MNPINKFYSSGKNWNRTSLSGWSDVAQTYRKSEALAAIEQSDEADSGDVAWVRNHWQNFDVTANQTAVNQAASGSSGSSSAGPSSSGGSAGSSSSGGSAGSSSSGGSAGSSQFLVIAGVVLAMFVVRRVI